MDPLEDIPEDSDPALDRVLQFMGNAREEGFDGQEIISAMVTAIRLVQAEFIETTQH